MTHPLPLVPSLELLLISGKGGVGKTTLACTLARQWAANQPGEQVLLLSTDPAHSLGDVLQDAVGQDAQPLGDRPNLAVRALDAKTLLQDFKARYGDLLELLVERGSFVDNEDLTPVWDLDWPGADELMSILEIQRLLREREADRVVVDMAPSGHTLNLFELMDFLDTLLEALNLFQEKHRVLVQTLAGRYTPDEADDFLRDLRRDLTEGRQLLQDAQRTACWIVSIAEPMSWLETQRFLDALTTLGIPCGGFLVNQIQSAPLSDDRAYEQQQLLQKFQHLAGDRPVWICPQQGIAPVGSRALDALAPQLQPFRAAETPAIAAPPTIQWPKPIPPSLPDLLADGRRLIIIGGKGGVGKTTVAAALALGLAQRHRDRRLQVISIDPAHSLGDAFGQPLDHDAQPLLPNLLGQEINADRVLDQFRADYLWELAEMMSGGNDDSTLQIAYGPQGWRAIADQALPGVDEMLSLLTVIDLLDRGDLDLILLDTAPTGHLLRFLEMPSALADWLAWIFKLWIKYQNVLGRTDFMGRLRSLRQRVLQAQKKLQDPAHTEFISVLQNQSAIIAETQRLTHAIDQLHIPQHYAILNRHQPHQTSPSEHFPHQTLIHLPDLPRSVPPRERLQHAAHLLLQH